jgi:hypothetical protein
VWLPRVLMKQLVYYIELNTLELVFLIYEFLGSKTC